jgi:hypothetical protein
VQKLQIRLQETMYLLYYYNGKYDNDKSLFSIPSTHICQSKQHAQYYFPLLSLVYLRFGGYDYCCHHDRIDLLDPDLREAEENRTRESAEGFQRNGDHERAQWLGSERSF